MTDRYQDFVSSSLGQLLVKNLGLPNPVKLDRYVAGSPLVDGTVVVGGTGRLVEHLPGILDPLGIETTVTPESGSRYRGLVFDASGLTDPTRLVALRDFFSPLMRSLERCARLVVIGTPPEKLTGEARVAQRALEGFTRSLGKEVGRGTIRARWVSRSAAAAPPSWSTSRRGRRAPSDPRWASCCRRSRRTSPVRSCGSAGR